MNPDKRTKKYISIIFILAILIYLYLIFNFKILDLKMLIFWTGLTILVESLLIPMPNNKVGVSVGSAINLASIIVGGPLLGTTASFLGFLFRAPKVEEHGYVHALNTNIYITLFNIAQSIIVTALMGILYIIAGGRVGEFSFLQTLLIMLIGIILNSIIISSVLASLEGEKFINIWYENIKGTFASAVAVGSIGIIIALAFIGYGYWAVILFLGPLLLARYSFKLYMETRVLYLSTIQALNSAMEAKDPYTYGHASRVGEYSVKIAEAYGLSFDRIQSIKDAAVLHDIGKIGVSDNVLNKTTKLTDAEYEEIKNHPSIGAEIIGKVDFLKKISKIIKHHHERYDGRGYPDGLSGDQIPIESSILSLADSYDAMITDRPYREALTKEEALKEIRDNSGTQFHPELAKIFCEILEKDENI